MAKQPDNNLPREGEDPEIAAGEYVLGVGDAGSRRDFERRAAADPALSDAMLRWTERLSALSGTYEAIDPPERIKAGIDARLFAQPAPASWWQRSGLWQGVAALTTAGFLTVTVWSANLYSDLGRERLQMGGLEAQLADARNGLAEAEARAGEAQDRAAQLAADLEAARANLAETETRLAELEQAPDPGQSARILVVALESGETDYRFLAVHEPGTGRVRTTLVSGEIPREQDYELWLVDPDADTVSLGVIGEGNTAVELDADAARLLETRGLLAVSIEQKGGSPTGVAQGPVVAVGKPFEL